MFDEYLFLVGIVLNLCVYWGITEKSTYLEGIKLDEGMRRPIEVQGA